MSSNWYFHIKFRTKGYYLTSLVLLMQLFFFSQATTMAPNNISKISHLLFPAINISRSWNNNMISQKQHTTSINKATTENGFYLLTNHLHIFCHYFVTRVYPSRDTQ